MSNSKRRFSNTWGIVNALAAIVAAFSIGCGDECTVGETRCSGNVLRYCDSDRGEFGMVESHWHEDTCPVACVVIEIGASCVDSQTPIAECAKGDGSVCWNGGTTYCTSGYPIHTSSPCAGSTRCVMSPACGAICALDDQPDARCSQGPFCDNGDVSTCFCGFVTDRYACGSPDLCREIGGEILCTRTSTPDPRCGDPSRTSWGFCDGSTAFECWSGFVVEDLTCDGSLTCAVQADGVAVCQK